MINWTKGRLIIITWYVLNFSGTADSGFSICLVVSPQMSYYFYATLCAVTSHMYCYIKHEMLLCCVEYYIILHSITNLWCFSSYLLKWPVNSFMLLLPYFMFCVIWCYDMLAGYIHANFHWPYIDPNIRRPLQVQWRAPPVHHNIVILSFWRMSQSCSRKKRMYSKAVYVFLCL